MLNLPPAILREANSLSTDSPWLILLDINIEGELPIRLVNNNEDITFQGNEYIAFGFQITMPAQSSKGEIPTVQLSVANSTRTLQTYVEQYSGGVGASVVLTVVNAAHLSDDYAELTTTLTVVGCQCNAQWVVFTLGAANPLNKKFPPNQYIAAHCRFKFRGTYCGYVGAESECNKTIDRCRELQNSPRFGGHLGLDGSGIRLV